MNILITGVHGFVGSNLVKALSPEEYNIWSGHCGSREGRYSKDFLME